jgi:triacylglycerol esterase/lipase EstA (alpha/beta hydrolase family)
MDTTTVIATTSSALFIGGSVLAVVRWALQNHTKTMVSEYLSELKPNHGTSLSDVIRLEVLPLIQELRAAQQKFDTKLDKVESKVDKLEGRFEQHVEEWNE